MAGWKLVHGLLSEEALARAAARKDVLELMYYEGNVLRSSHVGELAKHPGPAPEYLGKDEYGHAVRLRIVHGACEISYAPKLVTVAQKQDKPRGNVAVKSNEKNRGPATLAGLSVGLLWFALYLAACFLRMSGQSITVSFVPMLAVGCVLLVTAALLYLGKLFESVLDVPQVICRYPSSVPGVMAIGGLVHITMALIV